MYTTYRPPSVSASLAGAILVIRPTEASPAGETVTVPIGSTADICPITAVIGATNPSHPNRNEGEACPRLC